MVNIPQDVQESLKKLADTTKLPIKSLLVRLKEIYDTDDTVKTMEKEEHKIRFAWALLYREHSMTGKTTDCILMPVSFPRVREITMKGDKTHVGDITGVLQRIDKDEAGNPVLSDYIYASGTFWRDGAKNLKNLLPGKKYKTSLILKENKWGVSISSDRAGFVETDQKFIDFKSFYEQYIKPLNVRITIGEMDLMKSEDNTSIREIEATVMDVDIGEKDGREYGRYTVFDDSIIGSNFTIFVDPREAIWAQGSIVKYGGRIDIDEKTGTPRWSNQYVMPTDMAMPRELVVKSVKKQEEVDLNAPEQKEQKPVKKDEDDINFAI